MTQPESLHVPQSFQLELIRRPHLPNGSAVSQEHSSNSLDSAELPTPRVSVVMTVYDDVRFLDAAVASILAQDLRDLELILVDDGSSHRSEIARLAGRDPRIRLVRNAENVGPAAAANHGIACARAGIIARLDSDDIAEPTRIRRLVSVLDDDSEVGLVGTWFATMTESGAPREIIRLPTSDLEIRWAFLFFNPFCHSSVAFRRACFEAAGGYRSGMPAEDHDLWARMLRVCRGANIPEPLARYRLNSKGLTATLGTDRAFQDKLRGAYWQELGVRFDPDAARSIAVFISGYDIPPTDRPQQILATILILLRRFLDKPRPFERDEDRALAGRLVTETLARLRRQPNSSLPILLKAWRLRLHTLVSSAYGPLRSGRAPRRNPGPLLVPCPGTSDRRRIKILVIIPTLEVGGAEMDLVRNLPILDRGLFQIVVCTLFARGALTSRLIEAGIEVVGPFQSHSNRWLSSWRELRRVFRLILSGPRLPSWLPGWTKHLIALLASVTQSVALNALGYPACVRPLADHMRKSEYDVIHTVLPISYLYGSWANRLAARRPLLMGRVSLNWYQGTARLLGYLERHMLHSRVDTAICNSAAIRQQLEAEGIPGSKIRVIYNGIDLSSRSVPAIERQAARDRLGIGRDHLVLSSIGNLWSYKGHADLVRALHAIAELLPSAWVLLVVGRDADGNLPRLKELCVQLDLATHVRFLGERLDVTPVLCAADIHISASHTEGFPNNILEAMGSSLPVVATAVGGVPELVIDGETGLLVPPHAPDALGAAVLKLANNPELRARMGRAGHARAVANFSVKRSAAALADAYQSAAIRGRVPG